MLSMLCLITSFEFVMNKTIRFSDFVLSKKEEEKGTEDGISTEIDGKYT